MLHELGIADLALIEDLSLEFGPGLNVVTGETGAGKSLLQRALALAAGHRGGGEVVRREAEAARITARFDLPAGPATGERLAEIGVPARDGGGIEVVRTVARSGRGQVQLNGKTVALASLLEVGGGLVHLQGQHESLELARPETHLAMLDRAGGTEEVARRYREAFTTATRLVDRLDAL
ncbi:MAG: AAA family ATPase, partial [Alphaproteobacteria bacterium]